MGTRQTIILVDGEAPPRFIPSTRFTLGLLVFFAFIVQYAQRVNLPIAIVCMVNRTKAIEHPLLFNGTSSTVPNDLSRYPNKNDLLDLTSTTLKPVVKALQKRGFLDEKKFNWVELQQQILLGGYWAGYIFTQMPGGWLATTIGAKWVYAGSLFTSSVTTLVMTSMYLMPSTHFTLMFALRFIIGLAHGVLFPATIALWSVWAVPQERSTLASIGFCGTQFGTSITMLLGGLLCRYLPSGWMYLFSFTSVIGFIWLCLWIMLTSDFPSNHPTISSHERDYICKLTGTTARKMFNSLTSFIPVLCMISFYFCDHSRKLLGVATVLVFLAGSGLGYGSGYCVNFADIVPAYSGVIFGFANTFASLAGLIGNIVAGMVVTKPVLEQWRKLYVMFAIVYFIGGIVFLFFGTAVPRKWAKFQSAISEKEKKLNDEESVPMNEEKQIKA